MTETTIKCLIIDDEKLGRDLIAAHLNQLPQFEVVAECSSAIKASQVLNQHHIDLLFLDIEMPVLKGTDFYQNLNHKPKVIFTTAYREYALDGFELEAIDYLLKPITFARFFKAIERFLTQHSTQDQTSSEPKDHKDHLFVRADRKAVKIKHAEIRYIQGLKDYIEIHTLEETWLVKNTLGAFLKLLPPEFMQVHRSYIVNINHITAYTNHDIELADLEIPIGKTHQKPVLKKLS